jgi:ABC-type dipeptide/oligopeptide/nickel transport system permease subunit
MLGSRGWILLVLFLVLLVAASIVPDVFAPHDHDTQNLRARLLGPGESSTEGFHLLGTDSLGRDLFSRMVVGTRLTLFIAVTATLIGAGIGVLFGLLGGYFGGRTDRLLMRLGEAQTAMPMFLVAILLLSLLGPSVGILLVVLPCLVWPIFARVVRAITDLAERGSDERKLLESVQTHLRTHGGATVPRSMGFDYEDAS